jgi:putative transcriptional regulator
VQPNQAFVLHSNEYIADGTIVLQGGVAVTGNTEVLRAIAGGKGPRNKLLIMGYAGWGPEQLEGEIKANAWFTIPTDKELIFDQQVETKWERARAKRKIAL